MENSTGLAGCLIDLISLCEDSESKNHVYKVLSYMCDMSDVEIMRVVRVFAESENLGEVLNGQ